MTPFVTQRLHVRQGARGVPRVVYPGVQGRVPMGVWVQGAQVACHCWIRRATVGFVEPSYEFVGRVI